MKKSERGKVLFDDIDLRILNMLKAPYVKKISVIDLSKQLDINHKNLKPHINKLITLDLIFPYQEFDGKIYLASTLENAKQLSENDFDNKKDFDEMLQERIIQQGLMNMLYKADIYLTTEKMFEGLELDLRKKQNIPIIDKSNTLPKELLDKLYKNKTSLPKEFYDKLYKNKNIPNDIIDNFTKK